MKAEDRSSTNRRQFLAMTGGAVLGTALVGGCGATGGAGGGRRLRFAYEGPPETAQGIAANLFKKKLESSSGGDLELALYPGAQLGGEPELLQKIRAGDIDFIISSTANAAQIAPQSGVFSLHYLFKNKDDAKNVVTDEAVNQAYRAMATKSVDGAQPLTLFTLPLRNFYARFEVPDVQAIKGKKVRVQATRTEDVTFKTYGAQTVHMSFTELYTALQTGVVDLAENAVTYYGLNKHYEVGPTMSFSEHEGNVQVLWISEQAWQELSGQERDWVTAAADEVRAKQPSAAFELEAELKKKYAGMGVKFVEDVDKESFAKLSVPLQDRLAKELGSEAEKILRLVRRVTGDS
ncbi:MAG: C4-dicarboxylate ABC transporter substrate-binding protein [Streptosporangiales bacterium]|nr:C4-dicarboxylate ABC transporter substrate-binding protein [Streptosporangiales bacterium]